MSPSLSVAQAVPSWRRKLAPALSSPPKQNEPSTSPGTNHLKPTGTSDNRRPSLLTTRSIILLPLRSVCEQVADSHGKVMIGVHQARRWTHNPMPVCVSVIAEGQLELIF